MSRATTTIDRLTRLWDEGDLDLIDELYTENHVIHNPNNPLKGRSEVRAWVKEVLKAFPDFHVNFHEWVEQGDVMSARWTASGTHRGDFRQIPATGKTVVVAGISFSKFSGDRLAETWMALDDLGMMQQLGAIPEFAE